MKQKIINLFTKGNAVFICNDLCTVLQSSKPTSSEDETKTDLYLLLNNKNELFAFFRKPMINIHSRF